MAFAVFYVLLGWLSLIVASGILALLIGVAARVFFGAANIRSVSVPPSLWHRQRANLVIPATSICPPVRATGRR
ncbi:hypothetical protein [Kribbella albertanoniae]|uniref:hypothetical protein n=1 Tax=Kribbella albertanoniae TaxID=1266829 RepID=UPI001EE14FD5|nr:hypothetical protein [Kribbella albertanoniae]